MRKETVSNLAYSPKTFRRWGGLSKATVTNPKYVTAEDKEALLERILDEYTAENPKTRTMPFSTVHLVLQDKFHIVTRSAGLFFRNQLKEYETEGGNKNTKSSLVVEIGPRISHAEI